MKTMEMCITIDCPLSKECKRHTEEPSNYSSVTLFNVKYFKAYDWYHCNDMVETKNRLLHLS